MNTDFRVAVSLPTHPKALKLMRRCGDIAFYNLIRFWAFVAQNRPDGDLSGLDVDDIELAAGWTGECSKFYQALLDLCFLHCSNDGLHVHDWAEHNGFAAHAKDRSEKARKAAESRWKSEKKVKKMQGACSEQCYEHDLALQSDATSNAPSPNPYPNPYPNPIPVLKEILPPDEPAQPDPPQKTPTKKTTKRKTTIPADFQLSEKMFDFAISRGVQDPETLFLAFHSYHTGKGTLMLDWEAAWRTWVLNEIKFHGTDGNNGKKVHPALSDEQTAIYAKVWRKHANDNDDENETAGDDGGHRAAGAIF